jgi:hypothetical protein
MAWATEAALIWIFVSGAARSNGLPVIIPVGDAATLRRSMATTRRYAIPV